MPQICYGCLKAIEDTPDLPAICKTCWDRLTAFQRLDLMERFLLRRGTEMHSDTFLALIHEIAESFKKLGDTYQQDVDEDDSANWWKKERGQ